MPLPPFAEGRRWHKRASHARQQIDKRVWHDLDDDFEYEPEPNRGKGPGIKLTGDTGSIENSTEKPACRCQAERENGGRCVDFCTILTDERSQMRRRNLAPGTRVRLSDAPIPMELDVLTGTVVRPDDYGCYIVRLDQPGRYFHADGRVELLEEIREMWDNLTIIAPVKGRESSGAGRQA